MDRHRAARINRLALVVRTAELKMVESIEEAGPISSYRTLLDAKASYDTVLHRVFIFNTARAVYREALLAP
jgi:hypothetical protein